MGTLKSKKMGMAMGGGMDMLMSVSGSMSMNKMAGDSWGIDDLMGDDLSDEGEEAWEEVAEGAMPPMPCPAACAAACVPPAPPADRALAARVSRGSMEDRWSGLGVTSPSRDTSQHVTVTVTIYNTVAGGVPSVDDVRAAVEDMEGLYKGCGWSGRLADAGAGFMKSELTVNDLMAIQTKLVEQPYVPPPAGLVEGGDVFPAAT